MLAGAIGAHIRADLGGGGRQSVRERTIVVEIGLKSLRDLLDGSCTDDITVAWSVWLGKWANARAEVGPDHEAADKNSCDCTEQKGLAAE